MKTVERIWALITVDHTGDESVAVAHSGVGFSPMVGLDREGIDLLREAAIVMCRMSAQRIEIRRYELVEVEEVIEA